ncbi:hypothetical protein D9M71_587990 [compost metagenome]
MASSGPVQAGMYRSRMIRSGWKSASSAIVRIGSVRLRVSMPAPASTRSVYRAWVRESSMISTRNGSCGAVLVSSSTFSSKLEASRLPVRKS